MKVLFLTNIPSPYRVDFFQELGKLCELTVLYELKKASDRDNNWKRIIENKSYKEVFLKPVVKQASSAWGPSVIRYLQDRSYDVIVVGVYSTPTGIQAIQYLKKHKVSYLLNCDGGIISYKEQDFKRKLKTWLIGGADGYLSTGSLSDEYLEYYGADAKKIYHYPFTTIREKEVLERPLNKQEKTKLREDLRIPEEKMILTVGNFIPRKGFDVLLRAAELLDRKYGIYLVGGEEIEEYRILREQFHLENVHYIPFLQKTEIQKYYCAADLFVLPTREDIWGLVINEAMAAGLPVITTERCVAGITMLEENCIVPIEQEKVLAAKISEFLEKPIELERQAIRNLNKSREYTIENMARTHLHIFNSFLEDNK